MLSLEKLQNAEETYQTKKAVLQPKSSGQNPIWSQASRFQAQEKEAPLERKPRPPELEKGAAGWPTPEGRYRRGESHHGPDCEANLGLHQSQQPSEPSQPKEDHPRSDLGGCHRGRRDRWLQDDDKSSTAHCDSTIETTPCWIWLNRFIEYLELATDFVLPCFISSSVAKNVRKFCCLNYIEMFVLHFYCEIWIKKLKPHCDMFSNDKKDYHENYLTDILKKYFNFK